MPTPTTNPVDHRGMRETETLLLDQRVHGTGEADRTQHRADDVDAPADRASAPGARRRRACVVRYSVTASGTTLIPNTHRQLSASTSSPPSGGPTTNAVPVHAVHVPIARGLPRAGEPGLIIASELGTRNAAPTPCRQRAATRTQPVGATAHNSDATAKITSPARSTLSLPNWSDTAPGDQDQRAERQQIPVDDPLLQRQSAAEVRGDGGQGQVDHRPVEERHERRQYRDRDQGPVGRIRSALASIVSRRAPPRPSPRRLRRMQGTLGGADRQVGDQRGDRSQRPPHRDARHPEQARLVVVVEDLLDDEPRREHQHPDEGRDVECVAPRGDDAATPRHAR